MMFAFGALVWALLSLGPWGEHQQAKCESQGMGYAWTLLDGCRRVTP